MADKIKEPTLEELKAELAAAQTQNESLKKELDEANSTVAQIKRAVPGKLSLTYVDRAGESQKATVSFADGHERIRVKGNIVSSEAILTIANGKKAKDEHLKMYPYLRKITRAAATEIIRDLVEMQYGYLIVK